MIAAIVIALLGFLVMSGLENNSNNLFSEDRSSIGEINGTKVKTEELSAMEQRIIDNAKRENPKLSEEEQTQLKEQAWEELVNQKLLEQEYEKLGIKVTDKELRDMLTSEYADPMIQQNFRDPNTGIFDPTKVKQYIDQLRTSKDTTQKNQWRTFEDGLIKQRMAQKYNALMGMGINMPKGMVEMTNEQRNTLANIDYVAVPYTSVKDDEAKVTDDDCKTYINKYASIFKIEEPLRTADYVSFDIIPSALDTQNSLGAINNVSADFASTDKVEEFIAKNSMMMYDKKFYAAGRGDTKLLDSAMKSAVGSLVGPYYEDGMYKLTRVLAKKEVPDSVKASHILIAYSKDNTEETVKAKADSIFKAIKNGANFEQLASTLSDDGGSKTKAGDLGYFAQGAMVQEFNDYVFGHKTGEMDTVKSQYGIHIVKITDQKDFKLSTQAATLAKAMVAGEATINTAYTKANTFAATIKDKASYEAAIKKAGITKRVAENIRRGQTQIADITNGRELVRWMFDANNGDVSTTMNLKDKYVIACLTNKVEAGIAPVSLVKKSLEGIIRNQKKTKIINDKYKGKTLEAIATAAGVTVLSSDSLRMDGNSNSPVSNEQKVLGAAFNKANQNKTSEALSGREAVYFVKVKAINKLTTTVDPMMIAQEKNMMQMQQMQNIGRNLPFMLKKKAKVKDSRYNFM